MNFVYNTSGAFCKLDEGPKTYKLQQQVWPCTMQNQTSDYTSFTVESPETSLEATASTSCSPLNENSSDADGVALLFGPARPVQAISVTAQPSSLVDSEVEIRPPKRHYAHISFVSSVDGLKPVVRCKRKRTAFTTEQIIALETVFRNKPYVTREERGVLVEKLGVADQAIKVWFQNRRLKQKKEIEEELEAMRYPEYNMFAHTEILLHQVDKDGRVALNQQSIDELVNAIDAFLPKDLDLGKLFRDSIKSKKVEEIKSFTDTIHEPISPPEVEVSELASCKQEWWDMEVIDPKQSLQRLLDLHRSL